MFELFPSAETQLLKEGLETRMPSSFSPVAPPSDASTKRNLRHRKQTHGSRPAVKWLQNAAQLPVSSLVLSLVLCALVYAQDARTPLAPVRAQTATGPLRVNSANRRYFTDGSRKAIYLTGSHTWANLIGPRAIESSWRSF